MIHNKFILSAIIAFFSISSFAQKWKAGNIIENKLVTKENFNNWFVADTISDEVFTRIKGKSFSASCTVPRSDLRYITLIHHNKNGKIQRGELICNKSIAKDLIDIFKELYQADYVIERMVLVDEYDANDEKSMAANNSSCFNFRFVTGTKTVSKHGTGRAIDINPLYNPCYDTRNGKTEPAAGKPYAINRTGRKYNISFINTQDLCYKLFIAHGFKWGGNWKTKKDYQHFEK